MTVRTRFTLIASGFEVRGIDSQPNHELLFGAGIPVIEWLCNLDNLSRERVTLFVLPWNVKGLESSPVRVIAIEEEVDHHEDSNRQ